MRSRSLFIFATAVLLAGAGLAAEEPTVDQIIAENIEAKGGRATIESVDSVRVQGNMLMGQAGEVPFTLLWKRPDRLRMEFQVQGQTGVQAYDGEVGWMHMPFMGAAEPQKMPAEATAELEQQADIVEGPLFDYEEKGHTVEYLGTEEVEGTPSHVLRATMKDGKTVQTYYLDTGAYLTIRQVTERSREDQTIKATTSVGNYKEVDGLVMPFAMETKIEGAPEGAPGQAMTIETVELNVPIDDERFAFPEEGASAPESDQPEQSEENGPGENG